MNASLKQMLPEIETWPQEDQEALAEYARELQAARTGVYVMSDEEWSAVQEGLEQADRGEFATPESIAALWKRFGQ